MANKYSTNPVKIDSAFAATVPPFGQSRVHIDYVVWGKQGAAGDRLLITDKNGNTILDVTADIADKTLTFNLCSWWDGIAVAQIDSGVLELFM